MTTPATTRDLTEVSFDPEIRHGMRIIGTEVTADGVIAVVEVIDPEMRRKLGGDVGGYSVADLTENDSARTRCDGHLPVQHRDGKGPWCNRCGLTMTYLEPSIKFGALNE